jgi:hypothetical protein
MEEGGRESETAPNGAVSVYYGPDLTGGLAQDVSVISGTNG